MVLSGPLVDFNQVTSPLSEVEADGGRRAKLPPLQHVSLAPDASAPQTFIRKQSNRVEKSTTTFGEISIPDRFVIKRRAVRGLVYVSWCSNNTIINNYQLLCNSIISIALYCIVLSWFAR